MLAEDDDILFAACDIYKAALVDAADVARFEPIAVKCFGGCLFVAPIALHNYAAADIQLAFAFAVGSVGFDLNAFKGIPTLPSRQCSLRLTEIGEHSEMPYPMRTFMPNALKALM